MSDTPEDTPSSSSAAASDTEGDAVLDELDDAVLAAPLALVSTAPVEPVPTVCQRPGCGRPLQPVTHAGGSPRRYCSMACKRAAALLRPKHPPRHHEDGVDRIATLEDALLAQDAIRLAILRGKVTPPQGRAASGAVAEWVRAHAALTAQRVVTELRVELDKKAKEITELRAELARQRR